MRSLAMTEGAGPGIGRIEELRREFDAGFALSPRAEERATVDLLAVRVAGRPYAIRLRDIGGVVSYRGVVALPSAAPALLGLAGIHGGVAPVFNLAQLLGNTPHATEPRWLVFAGGDPRVAFALEEIESYLRTAPSEVLSEVPGSSGREAVDGGVRVGGVVRPLIALGRLIESIRGGIVPPRPREE